MRFKVPKDVDIEDRIVGPLTVKQLAWLGGGGGICLLLWKLIEFQVFVFVGIIIMSLSASFAFVRPYNQSLVAFCGSVLLYISKPKLYIWRRIEQIFPKNNQISKNPKSDLVMVVKKGLSASEIENLAETLDTSGKS